METRIGKIATVDFGFKAQGVVLFGVIYTITSNDEVFTSGAKYFCDTTKNFQYSAQASGGSAEFLTDMTKVLTDAGVSGLEELVGKPVQVELENGEFHSFRILTELL